MYKHISKTDKMPQQGLQKAVSESDVLREAVECIAIAGFSSRCLQAGAEWYLITCQFLHTEYDHRQLCRIFNQGTVFRL